MEKNFEREYMQYKHKIYNISIFKNYRNNPRNIHHFLKFVTF